MIILKVVTIEKLSDFLERTKDISDVSNIAMEVPDEDYLKYYLLRFLLEEKLEVALILENKMRDLIKEAIELKEQKVVVEFNEIKICECDFFYKDSMIEFKIGYRAEHLIPFLIYVLISDDVNIEGTNNLSWYLDLTTKLLKIISNKVEVKNLIKDEKGGYWIVEGVLIIET
ncbi:MAG: hypothetical protein ACO2O4_04190 [Minisyncoccia bacterium]|jgi:hypothetical protein